MAQCYFVDDCELLFVAWQSHDKSELWCEQDVRGKNHAGQLEQLCTKALQSQRGTVLASLEIYIIMLYIYVYRHVSSG
jgi:hypothetical protein